MPPSGAYDFRIPVCSVHRVNCERSDTWEWHCPLCADEWLQDRVDTLREVRSSRGVEAPERAASFKDIWPNRAARRRSRRSR